MLVKNQTTRIKKISFIVSLRQGLERIARKGGGRMGSRSGRATGGSYCPRLRAAHGLPTADYERKARRRAQRAGAPKEKL